MIRTLITVIILLYTLACFGQTPDAAPPTKTHEVSGIVQDTTGNPISSVSIILTSTKDTLKTSTNPDGIFIFDKVKSASFLIKLIGIGITTAYHKYLYNPNTVRIILDPITISSKTELLKEVVIRSKPTIVYKTDTVEYRADDYKVREDATVDELLKKMEGMEVGTNGTLSYLGQPVLKARLNGKDFSGGDVAQAIQNLPAEIVEKVQIIDDFGDIAARTGIKNGDPTKVLNITTKLEKSVGNMARVIAGAGNNDRFESKIFAERINGNQQIGLIGSFKNIINGSNNNEQNSAAGFQSGAATAGTVGDNGGTTLAGGPSLNYRNQFGKKIEIVANYTYTYKKVNTIDKTTGQQFSTDGNTAFNSSSISNSIINTHDFKFELDYTISNSDFLKVVPSFVYSTLNNNSNFGRQQTGIINQDISGINDGTSKNIRPGGTLFFQHLFANPKKNISFQARYNSTDDDQESTQNNKIVYISTAQGTSVDSLFNRFTSKKNLDKNYSGIVAFSEPIGLKSQLEITAQVNSKSFHNDYLTYNVDKSNARVPIDSLNSLYNYSFTEFRFSSNYKYSTPKLSFAAGLTALPSVLKGRQLSPNLITQTSTMNFLPILQFQYNWSKEEKITFNYSGSPAAPSYLQLRPTIDFTNPQNPVQGNPYLKPSFRHTFSTQYNHYIANSELNLLANFNFSLINNQVTVNNILIPDVNNTLKTLTTYQNIDGTYTFNTNHSITKQLNERQYSLALNGSVGYTHSMALNNNEKNSINTLRVDERFGPRLNLFSWLELNPLLGYDLIYSKNSLPYSLNSNINTFSLNLDGRITYNKYLLSYSASKNYITGIDKSIQKNPFVINVALEKGLSKKNNFTILFQAFDLLNQNKLINRVITDNSIIDTQSNLISRYFMIGFKLYLQKWGAIPLRNGTPRQRRGDGSFIY